MRMCACECTNTHTFTHSSQAIWLGLGQQGHLLFAIPVAMLDCTGGPSLEKAGGSCLHRLTPPLTRLCFPLTFHLSVTTSAYQKSLLGQALVSDMQAQEWVLPLPLRTEARRLRVGPPAGTEPHALIGMLMGTNHHLLFPVSSLPLPQGAV